MPIYKSKNNAHYDFFNILKIYLPFVLMTTKCSKVDYWFQKQRIRGTILNLTQNTQLSKTSHIKRH